MIVSVEQLKPLGVVVHLYRGENKLEEMTLSDFHEYDTVVLMDDSMRIESCSDFICKESVSLTVDAHIGSSHYFKYLMEIPFFLFTRMRNRLSDSNECVSHKNRIVYNNKGITLCEGNSSFRTISMYDWNDSIIINKYVFGNDWKYWFDKCDYNIYNMSTRIVE